MLVIAGIYGRISRDGRRFLSARQTIVGEKGLYCEGRAKSIRKLQKKLLNFSILIRDKKDDYLIPSNSTSKIKVEFGPIAALTCLSP